MAIVMKGISCLAGKSTLDGKPVMGVIAIDGNHTWTVLHMSYIRMPNVTEKRSQEIYQMVAMKGCGHEKLGHEWMWS